jgi:transposase
MGEAQEKERKKIVINSKQAGLSVEMISTITGLSVEDVKAIS